MTDQGVGSPRGIGAAGALRSAAECVSQGRLFDAGTFAQQALGIMATLGDGPELEQLNAVYKLTVSLCQKMQAQANQIREALADSRPDSERCQHTGDVHKVLHVDWCAWCGAMRTSRPDNIEQRPWIRPRRDAPMDAERVAVVRGLLLDEPGRVKP